MPTKAGEAIRASYRERVEARLKGPGLLGTAARVTVRYAASRLTAARERLTSTDQQRDPAITRSQQEHGSLMRDEGAPSAFATPPLTRVRIANRSYPDKSHNPPRKRTRKWRAQVAKSMAAHASASPRDNQHRECDLQPGDHEKRGPEGCRLFPARQVAPPHRL